MRRKWPRAALAVLGALALGGSARAEGPTLDEMSLQEMLDLEVTVATRTPVAIRDTPGIVTLITREEIIALGARDLFDILTFVPGFWYGVDVLGATSFGFRGNWAQEGKILVMIDGHEMNELSYASGGQTLHFPADQIERIEIVRGPGSAVYGGFAEFAVIDVQTRGARLHGGNVTATGAVATQGLSRGAVGLQYGDTFPALKDLAVSASGYYGRGVFSERPYVDFTGNSYSMREASAYEPMLFQASASVAGFELRFLYDSYGLQSRDGYGDLLQATAQQRFTMLSTHLKYLAKIHPRFTLTPRISYLRQQPWRVADDTSEVFYDKTVERLRGSLLAEWNPLDDLKVMGGVEGTFDHGRLNRDLIIGAQQRYAGDKVEISYLNFAAYVQGTYTHWIANLTAGARYELHSAVGPSFVPRVALTKTIGPVHFKVLYAQAFRAPAFENISLGTNIKPERTQVIEGEAGLQVKDTLSLSVNVFDITVRQPILFLFDTETQTEGYLNSDPTGTRGFEVTGTLKGSWGWLNASYSFYSAIDKNFVALYNITDNPAVLQGMPAHKVTAHARIKLASHLAFAPAVVVASARFGTLSIDENGDSVHSSTPPAVLINLNLVGTDVGLPGLDISGGIMNLLDHEYGYLQGYDGGHAPLPAMGREFFLRLSYSFDTPGTRSAPTQALSAGEAALGSRWARVSPQLR